MTEYLLIGWEQIHRMLKDKSGNSAISLSTLRQSYGPDMKRLGVVFEFHIGRGKRPSICAWPSRIIWYFTARYLKGKENASKG